MLNEMVLDMNNRRKSPFYYRLFIAILISSPGSLDAFGLNLFCCRKDLSKHVCLWYKTIKRGDITYSRTSICNASSSFEGLHNDLDLETGRLLNESLSDDKIRIEHKHDKFSKYNTENVCSWHLKFRDSSNNVIEWLGQKIEHTATNGKVVWHVY